MSLKTIVFYSMIGVAMLNAGNSFAYEAGSEYVIGDSTTAWLNMQANGTQAAQAAPMTGAQASAAYTRYMKSFEREIPARFDSSVKEGARARVRAAAERRRRRSQRLTTLADSMAAWTACARSANNTGLRRSAVPVGKPAFSVSASL